MRMNVNTYLPDDLAERAKAEGLNLSRMLRDAVTEELERREAVSETLSEMQEFKLPLEDEEGNAYIGRIAGKIIGVDRDRSTVFLTEDERVIGYDREHGRYWILEDNADASLEDSLHNWLPDDTEYMRAMAALGEVPEINL